MTAIEIAIGMTSAMWLGVCCAAMIRSEMERVYTEHLVILAASKFGIVWFGARLWGFA